ncbi:MAG: 5'-nucleotidase C-terminal domain-containing protein [Candidatus Bathyarchaeota archaeon]|nr:MAG: 5'-nucleotidase C-terminal domain-containing protein [Candidatus Bathyarchaeota archaeon]
MHHSKQLTLLQVNDSHGYFELHPELYWQGATASYRKAGGFARIATLFTRIRKENPLVIALDNGDTLHGTFPSVNSKGKSMVPILNALAFDAMTAHWEFAYGPTQFNQIIEKLNYPMLAINCYHESTGKLAYPPFTIIERGGLRVGVIGIAATIVDKTMPPHFSQGLRFTLGNRELPEYIQHLRQKRQVDLVVVISHLGYPQELKLAQEVSGIDVLLSGHTHNRVYNAVVVNGTIVIQSGCHGSFIGRLDLQVENQRVYDFRHELINVDESIPPEPEVETLVNEVLVPHRDRLETVVGYSDTALHRNIVLEAPMDNLLLHALLDVSGAELAFSNGWRYGAPILPGAMTRNDLWNIIPTNPPVSVCELTGSDLWRMMEENLEHTFSRDPYQQMGGYVKRCLGLHLFCKLENPENHRIQELFIGNTRLKRDKSYTACFVTEQGVPKDYGSHRYDLPLTAIDALERYLRKHNRVSVNVTGTTIVPI